MKILHITFSKTGGAGIGVKRLEESLKQKKIKNEIFYFDEFINSKFQVSSKIIWYVHIYLKKILIKFLSSLKKKNSISLNIFSNFNLSKLITRKNPDIVHLHWIGNEMISIKQISQINKPLVWTMHDMWPFSGCEHYTSNNRFINGFNSNNRPYNEKGLDLDKFVWRQKFKYLKKKNINIICPSNWVENKVKKSLMFRSKKKFFCPYMIDQTQWKILPKKKIFIFTKPPKKKTVIFFNATSSVNYRKGFNYLVEVINKYLKKENYFLLVAGTKPKLFDDLLIEKKFVGNVNSQKLLNKIYCSSDILVVPSILETFGQVFAEAGACGIPSVAFNHTGASDIIDHKTTGYLAKYKSSKDLENGIKWCEKKIKFNKNFSNIIRKKIIKKFSYKKNASRMIVIYKKILKDNQHLKDKNL